VDRGVRQVAAKRRSARWPAGRARGRCGRRGWTTSGSMATAPASGSPAAFCLPICAALCRFPRCCRCCICGPTAIMPGRLAKFALQFNFW